MYHMNFVFICKFIEIDFKKIAQFYQHKGFTPDPISLVQWIDPEHITQLIQAKWRR